MDGSAEYVHTLMFYLFAGREMRIPENAARKEDPAFRLNRLT